MKKFLALPTLFTLLTILTLSLSGCGSAVTPVIEEENEDITNENKTIGEQIEEAKEGLEDCEKSCANALTTEIKEQCLLSCQMARTYTEQLEEMTKGIQDKTSKELEEAMKEMYGITE